MPPCSALAQLSTTAQQSTCKMSDDGGAAAVFIRSHAKAECALPQCSPHVSLVLDTTELASTCCVAAPAIQFYRYTIADALSLECVPYMVPMSL